MPATHPRDDVPTMRSQKRQAGGPRQNGSATAVTGCAGIDMDAEEDDDFAAEVAGASDAECEESLLEELEPIEPDEVLDLVDARSASESIDASEESETELEASSSRLRPPGRTLIPVVNKAKPLFNNTEYAATQQPSALYPHRSSQWRAPILIAQLNSAASIASRSTVNASYSSHIFRFPPPVFAKAPPIASKPPPSESKACGSETTKDSHVVDDIPPPCEPEGDDCVDWSTLRSSFCPASPSPIPTAPTSQKTHVPPQPFPAASRQIPDPGNAKAVRAVPVNSAKLLRRGTPQFSDGKLPMRTSQSLAATAPAVQVSSHEPSVHTPTAGPVAHGTAAPQQAIHRLAGALGHRPPLFSTTDTVAGPTTRPGYHQGSNSTAGWPRQSSSSTVLRESHAGVHAHSSKTGGAHGSLMSNSPPAFAVQPPHNTIPTCPLQKAPFTQQQHSCETELHQAATQSAAANANCHEAAEPDSTARLTGESASESADPLSEILGEIDQFILSQDACMLPEDHLPTILSSPSPRHISPAPAGLRDVTCVGSPSASHSQIEYRSLLNTSAGPLAVDTASNDNGDKEGHFMPKDSDFEPLTPRAAVPSVDEFLAQELGAADWDAMFAGISPIGVDVDANWVLDGGSSPAGLLSPEVSLSPLLQQFQQPAAHCTAALQVPAGAKSPAVCHLSMGSTAPCGGGAVESHTSGAAGRHAVSGATLACCATQGSPQPHINGGGDGGGGQGCSGDVMGQSTVARGETGGRSLRPVARRLNLTIPDASQQHKQCEALISRSEEYLQSDDPFAVIHCTDAALDEVTENRNDSNQCGSSSQPQPVPGDRSGRQQAGLQQPSAAAVDALQELFDEVDAAVAAGDRNNFAASAPSPSRSSVPDHVDKSSSPLPDPHSPDAAAERHTFPEINNGASAVGDTEDSMREANQQFACPESGQHADAMRQNAHGDRLVHESSSIDRAGGEEPMQNDTAEFVEADHSAAAAAVVESDSAMNLSFEDIGDDDLYILTTQYRLHDRHTCWAHSAACPSNRFHIPASRFAATCTGSLGEFRHPSLPTFTDVLLNDDADLDWFETEAPNMDMLDVGMERAPQDVYTEDTSSLPHNDTLSAAQMATQTHLGSAGCDRGGASAGDAGIEKGAAGCGDVAQAHKRKWSDVYGCQRDDEGADEGAHIDRGNPPQMSRFERYEKRCQLRENMSDHFESEEPLRPFTRSCREQLYAMPAASTYVATDTTQQFLEGAENSADWPGAAVSSTVDVPAASCSAEPAAQLAPESAAVEAHTSAEAAEQSNERLREPVMSAAQLRQLYAQVQTHAQLLVQTLALAAPGSIAPGVLEDVEKQWGWSLDAPCRQQSVAEEAVKECWRMITEWEQISKELAAQSTSKPVAASQVGALTVSDKHAAADCKAAAEKLCSSLQEGWRPVLVQGTAPCIAYVPWLCYVDDLTAALGTPRPPIGTTAIEVSTSALEGDQVLLESTTAAPEAPDPASPPSPKAAATSPPTAAPTTRGSRKPATVQSNFLVPVKGDPDEVRRVNCAKRLSRTSPFSAHVHAAFAKYAVFFNRALFPRIVQASLVCNDKRRKQISVCEQRLMAVCVMQHGRNYEMLSSLMPGWTQEHIKSRLHNYKRLIKGPGKDSGAQDLKGALADIINRVIDIVDGPLSSEEFELISRTMQETMDTVIGSEGIKKQLEAIAAHVVRWRSPRLLHMHWEATANAALPVLKGTPRPVQELRRLLSLSRLNGAHSSLYLDDDLSDEHASGLTCGIRSCPHTQYAPGASAQPHAAATPPDDAQAAEGSGDPAAAQQMRGAGAKKRGGKTRKRAVHAGEQAARAICPEEWPKAYRDDMVKHAWQLCSSLCIMPQAESNL